MTPTPKPCSKYDSEEVEPQFERLDLAKKDMRSVFEKDRARIIHSAAFRRMQGKTQVFGLGGSDFFRTRLTHSLETAQIGKGIALDCGNADTDLVEAACLGHDIGHPPFGHTGEDVLKEKMRLHGGFEANAQNLRILTRLEIRTSLKKQDGLNLSRATIDALLKYKKSYAEEDKEKSPHKWKFYYDEDKPLVEWASGGGPCPPERSFECEIMDWADEIAYSTHDLEDGIKAGMISESKITATVESRVKRAIGDKWNDEAWEDITNRIRVASEEKGTNRDMKGRRKDLVSHFVDEFVHGFEVRKRTSSHEASRYDYRFKPTETYATKCEILEAVVWELIIRDDRVATLEKRAKNIVGRLFEELTKFDDTQTTDMYPLDFREKLELVESSKLGNDEKELAKKRIACDFISGMTDGYATQFHSRIIGGDSGPLMEII